LPLAGNERKDEERVMISSSGEVALRFPGTANRAARNKEGPNHRGILSSLFTQRCFFQPLTSAPTYSTYIVKSKPPNTTRELLKRRLRLSGSFPFSCRRWNHALNGYGKPLVTVLPINAQTETVDRW
jgi:hypothetical protein